MNASPEPDDDLDPAYVVNAALHRMRSATAVVSLARSFERIADSMETIAAHMTRDTPTGRP